VAGLRLLPKHLLSRLVGRAAALRLPPRVQRWEIRAFARAVGVDFTDVRDDIDSFGCLQDFFTRALREGARPIDADVDAVVAPCDGFWGAAGTIADGTLLQVKGHAYSLAALLGDAAVAREFEGGPYATFYLSPRDYHRFHMPCAASVWRLAYIPGQLWPVNRIGVEGVDGLFAQNERLCAFLSVGGQRVDCCLVAVGATLVGKIRVTFDDLTTNLPRATIVTRRYTDLPPKLAKGEEWGRFEFGSTIVLVAAPQTMHIDAQPPGTPLRVGRRIGRLLG
jgi:phosphatidylserine decarboxylase